MASPLERPFLAAGDAPLTHGDVFKRLSALSIPMAMSFTFSLEMWLLVLFEGHLYHNKERLAAMNLISTLINGCLVIGLSPLFAMSAVVGKNYGHLQKIQREFEELAQSEQTLTREEFEQNVQDTVIRIARVNVHGLFIAVFMILLSGVPLYYAEELLIWARQDPQVARDVQSFTRPISYLATPGYVLRICPEQMLFGFGQTKPPMLMALGSAAIGMTIAYALGYGKMNAPNYGQEGILIGYSADAWMPVLSFSLYIACHSDFAQYAFFFPKQWDKYFHGINEILSIGFTIFLSNFVEMIAVVTTGILAGLLDVTSQDAYSMTMQLLLLTILIQNAFAQSCSQEMSRLIGEAKFDDACRFGCTSLLTTMAYVLPLPIIFSIQPRWLMSMLGQTDPAVESTLRPLVPIMTTCVAFDATRTVILRQLQNNLDEKKRATLISSGGLSIGVLLSWLLGVHSKYGVLGVASGWLMGLVLTTLPLLYLWNSALNRHRLFTLSSPNPNNNPSQTQGAPRVVEIPQEEYGATLSVNSNN